jgi:hypothetical protein
MTKLISRRAFLGGSAATAAAASTPGMVYFFEECRKFFSRNIYSALDYKDCLVRYIVTADPIDRFGTFALTADREDFYTGKREPVVGNPHFIDASVIELTITVASDRRRQPEVIVPKEIYHITNVIHEKI